MQFQITLAILELGITPAQQTNYYLKSFQVYIYFDTVIHCLDQRHFRESFIKVKQTKKVTIHQFETCMTYAILVQFLWTVKGTFLIDNTKKQLLIGKLTLKNPKWYF